MNRRMIQTAVALGCLLWAIHRVSTAEEMKISKIEHKEAKEKSTEKIDLFTFDWTWKDETGKKVKLSDYKGNKPIIIGMGYTSCKVSCPLTIRRLKSLQNEQEAASKVVPTILFVTLDPVVDTPEKLREYKKSWDLPQNWHFLSGSNEDITALASKIGVRFIQDKVHFEHSGVGAMLGGDGRIRHFIKDRDSISKEQLTPSESNLSTN